MNVRVLVLRTVEIPCPASRDAEIIVLVFRFMASGEVGFEVIGLYGFR